MKPSCRFSPPEREPWIPVPHALAVLWAVALAYGGGMWLHLFHQLQGATEEIALPGWAHWLRDSSLMLPIALFAVYVVLASVQRWRQKRRGLSGSDVAIAAVLGVAALTSLLQALGSPLHDLLFHAEHGEGHEEMSVIAHMAYDGMLALAGNLVVSFLMFPAVRLALNTRQRVLTSAERRSARASRMLTSLLAISLLLPLAGPARGVNAQVAQAPTGAPTVGCSRAIFADVVALDQQFFYNRMGASNPAGMVYALRRDVVDNNTGLTEAEGGLLSPGQVALRADKRPRPLVLRANIGDCLTIRFTNLLNPIPIGGQPADRHVGIHVNGLEAKTSIRDDGSFVGRNPAPGPDSGLVAPGETTTYNLFAQYENTYLLYNLGVAAGAEASGGTIPYGLFGAVNVEPSDWSPSGAATWQSEWYRSQLTRVEMDWATPAETYTDLDSNGVWDPGEPLVDTNGNGIWDAHRTTPGGHPILDYDAVYPASAPFGKVGLPIIKLLAPKAGYDGEIVHSDINAIIAGPGRGDFPNGYYPANEVYGSQDRNEPFREFTVIFHDEIFALQAFAQFYNDPNLRHALAIVKDGFAINYGTGGIGSEIIANRLGVGPMANCVECKYEEFFLTSYAVGDPAMIVDTPADLTVAPDANGNLVPNGQRATKALYPDDPSNVHHSYLNDHVKFRQLHAGPAEHHIFHLHAHQWQYNWNDPKSNYLDSQGIGPGSGFTYEIAYGGSGNRNKTVGDAIFHCHFYPHFAMGMWELWRVHDTFEQGTELNPDGTGTPAAHARALPDGEITAGTPIPGIVPLPSAPPTVPNQGMTVNAMAPMPDPGASVTPYDVNGDGIMDSSQIDLDSDGVADLVNGFNVAPAINPGYPFFIPGIAGHRPPTPALDIVDTNGDGEIEDGGLPRHIVTGGPNTDPLLGAVTHEQFQTRLDFNKELLNIGYQPVAEAGTPAEQVAMGFHGQLWHDSFLPDGTPVSAIAPIVAPNGRPESGFETNGLPAQPGAPFADPCRTDPTAANGWAVNAIPQNKTYKGVNIQFDMVMNKVGWHFPQQRILTLWQDANAILTGARPPEPLVMRLNAGDCASYWHTNLVPNVYELDDYQVRTPTDIIGQHIHLVKFDVTASDGSANGFNYEDGTLSPMEVQERIHAIRAHNACDPAAQSLDCPVAKAHPFFGPGPDNNGDGVGDWVGARTTIQRWYADPVLNQSWDNGVGSVFTHDHYGPSTHQQVGLYATVLVEPAGATYRDPETGTMMGSRDDGGPTSWRADILNVSDAAGKDMSHREFYFEFADFQHAYHPGGGAKTAMDNGAGVAIPSYADFNAAVAPPYRLKPPAGSEASLYFFPPVCPGPVGTVNARPCPEAISGADPGTYVVNYRNEPISERVYDPLTKKQAAGDAGNLAYAFSSLVTRAQAALNQVFGAYPPLTADVGGNDPATPLLRVYAGDKIRVRVQVGAHEEEHNFMIHGLKWQKEALAENSGWKNSEFLGISEYSIFEMPVVPDTAPGNPTRVDYLYTMGAQTEDYWNGVWGLLRSYSKPRTDLLELPNNKIVSGNGLVINNAAQFNQMCPINAPVVGLNVTAVRAADVLPGGTLVYNTRDTILNGPTALDPVTGEPIAFGPTGRGPLHDPTALMYVRDSDLIYDPVTRKPNGLKPGTPVEPLVLRARAGDCINLQLTNGLPAALTWTDPNGVIQPDMPGFSALPPITHKDIAVDPILGNGIITFNANDLTPSSAVGLHPQLVAYNVRTSDGFAAGGTNLGIVPAPGGVKTYKWYAGDVDTVPDASTPATNDYNLVATPVEFGATGLLPADRIKGSNKGLAGALIIEPQGSTWVEDSASRASATVTKADGTQFRDFVTVLQNDVNLRYTVDNVSCAPSLANLYCAVPNIHAEGGFVPEDAQDSGQKGINYGADPLWFRLGIAPETPFESLLGNTLIHQAFANAAVAGEDPQTAVFAASPTGPQNLRMRLVQTGGHARGISYTLNGHAWQREPYINGSKEIGENPLGWWNAVQEGISAGSVFNVNVQRGGYFNVVGDYLFRDHGSFGTYQGIWGILRHDTTPPQAGNDFYNTNKNAVLTVAAPGVLTNDVSLEAGGLTASKLSDPASGSLALNADGSFTFTPALNFTGEVSFTYAACLGAMCSAPATVFIRVGSAPVAVADSYSIVAGGTLSVAAPGVLVNDSDADGDALGATLVSGPAHAQLDSFGQPNFGLNLDGSFSYTPDPAYVGPDSFTYKACEIATAEGLCSAPVTVSIKANGAPVAIGDSYSVLANKTLSVAKPGVLSNDADPNGDALRAVRLVGPANGTLALNADGSFTYTPAANFAGSDSFQYQACETATAEKLCSAAATVTITVTNVAPVAANNSYSVAASKTLTVKAPGVLGNDTDQNGDKLGATLVTTVTKGTLKLNADGSFTYTATATKGNFTFTYKACETLTAAKLCSNNATVTITVK